MKIKAKQKTIGLLSLCLGSALALQFGGPAITSFAGTLGGKYYPDYSSYEEALEAAGEINLEVAEEGNVLLKNDGTLPLTGNEYVSIFGVSSSSLIGASGNTNSVGNASGVSARGPIYDSLVDAGFKVNGVLADYYAQGSGANSLGNEITEFSGSVAGSFNLYNDVGIIVLARSAGEGADAEMVTSEEEDNDYLGEEAGWEHDALFKGTYNNTVANRVYDNKSEHEYKHYLELTESEEDLIQFVEKHCDKVIVVLNTANAMEMYNLREDDRINGILLMGRPGETGHYSVGRILKGLVNPSGKLVDEWNTDFTADPTWANFGWGVQNGSQNMYYYSEDGTVKSKDDIAWGTHNQNGYYGVDYEEDIYLGYNYWETYYYEYYLQEMESNPETAAAKANEWWSKNVTFPFGYGLSYTKFSFKIDEENIYATGNDGKVSGFDLKTSDLETLFASSEGHPASVKTLYIPVTVKNTGNAIGKEVVEIYVTAPYGEDAKLEKSFVTLTGYIKTDLIRPGESQTVYVKVNVQDFSSFDYNDANENGNKGYELEKGEYVIRAMNTSHYDVSTSASDETDAYDEVKFELDKTINLELDDFSDNVATALFSEEFDIYKTSTDDDHFQPYTSLRTAEMSADGESEEVLLSRSTILTYHPEAPTLDMEKGTGDLVLKKEVIDNWEYWNTFGADDTEQDNWYVKEVPENWTQGTGKVGENGTYDITIDQMMGIPLYNEDGSFNEKWDTFMNQLTIDEMKFLVERQRSMWTTSALETIGKISSEQADSYNDVRTAGGTFLWIDSPTLSATWNTELAAKVGISRGNIEVLKGWSGYGGKEMDTHRSPFSGRNAEYLSQDGIQGGYIAAAFTAGMESKGVTCYIKHFALNDMETCRDGMCNNVWASEQAVRQIYFKVFQMAMQEGGASGAMTGFARFCGIPISMNHRMLVDMVTDEWGWEGFYITDGYSGVSRCTTMETMMRAHVIPLPLGSSVPTITGEWDASKRNGKGNVTVDGKENSTQYFYLRETAARILYADAKSNDVLNGFALAKLQSKDISAKQGGEIDETLGLSEDTLKGSTAVYTLASGSLPDGVTFSSDGKLSGKPTEAGSFRFTIDCKIDNWITSTMATGLKAEYTIEVESAFKIADGSDDLDKAEVGEEFYAAITSDTFKTGDEYSSVKYTLVSGDLASYGLALSEDGIISGTPTKSGTVELTVQIAVSSASSGGFPGGPGGGGFPGGPGGDFPGGGGFPGGPGGGSSATNYTFNATIVISGDEPVVENPKTIKDLKVVDGNLVITYSDDTTTTLELGNKTTSEVTIKDVTMDEEGNFVITYSDGKSSTLKIADGEKAIKDIQVNENGELTVTYTDGTTGTIKLPAASEDGGCGGVIGIYSGIGAVLVLVAAAAFLIRKKDQNA